jgi:carboxypeptidase T
MNHSQRQSSLTRFAILVALLAWIGTPVQAARTPPETFQTETSSTQSGYPKSLLARVYYTSRADLTHLATRLDVWEVHPEEGYLLALLTPEQQQELVQAGFQVLLDTSGTLTLHETHPLIPGQTSGIPGFPCYRTITETYASAQSIALAHPDLATWTSIGSTWEKIHLAPPAGYNLNVLRLTNSAVQGPKPKLFITASIHAREYAPAELLTRFAEYLVDRYGSDPEATWLLDYREIHLLLQANPDGRRQAELGSLWRKNTNQDYCTLNPPERGADLNRNFPFQWGGFASSGVQCDETYRGSTAASEPETQAIINYMEIQFPDQRPDDLTSPAPVGSSGLYVDLHSYGNLVLWPWGFTSAPAPNADALQTLGSKLAFFNGYLSEQSVDLYPTDGTTDDYAYGHLGLAAYAFEMGTAFFQDCATFEQIILPENLAALVYAAKAAGKPYLEPGGPDALVLSANPQAVLHGESAQFTAIIDDSRYSVVGNAVPLRDIQAAEYNIDTPPWITTTVPISHTMAALDGAFDQVTETVTATIDTTALSLGRHILFVRGMDDQGNWGMISAAFLDIVEKSYLPVTFK